MLSFLRSCAVTLWSSLVVFSRCCMRESMRMVASWSLKRANLPVMYSTLFITGFRRWVVWLSPVVMCCSCWLVPLRATRILSIALSCRRALMRSRVAVMVGIIPATSGRICSEATERRSPLGLMLGIVSPSERRCPLSWAIVRTTSEPLSGFILIFS